MLHVLILSQRRLGARKHKGLGEQIRSQDKKRGLQSQYLAFVDGLTLKK